MSESRYYDLPAPLERISHSSREEGRGARPTPNGRGPMHLFKSHTLTFLIFLPVDQFHAPPVMSNPGSDIEVTTMCQVEVERMFKINGSRGR